METKINLSKTEFSRVLAEFRGTDIYHLHRLPNGMSIKITDGCSYVREHAGGGAYWLYDLILSYQMKLRNELFQVWKLTRQPDQKWYVECSDGNGGFLVGQEIPYSDFPIDSIELWLIDGVCLLPSEY